MASEHTGVNSRNSQHGSLPADRKWMLGMLRDARAMVYRDSESFADAVAVLEHVGQVLLGKICNGLNSYEKPICDLARAAPTIQCERIAALFKTVREARNDAVHSGDYIRHHAIRLVELLLVLEEGISMSGTTAGDLMVPNPVTAELWQNIATVRRTMLTNSFSFLPLQDDSGEWKLLSDVSVVRYLMSKPKDRNALLGEQLRKAVDKGELELTKCKPYSPEKGLDEIAKAVQDGPVLIVEEDGDKQRLLGILTAFDLL